MSEYVIPCDTIRRLAPVAFANPDVTMQCLRLDRGCVVASSGKVMVIEHVGFDAPVTHVMIDPALYQQCFSEYLYHGKVTFGVTEILRYTTAKTTFGFISSVNAYAVASADFDKWHEITLRAGAPLVEPGPHGMMWELDQLQLLVQSSPSGKIALERNIDAQIKPVFMTDAVDPNWLAIARPHDFGDLQNPVNPARFPGWMV